jgi:hypothetical protein
MSDPEAMRMDSSSHCRANDVPTEPLLLLIFVSRKGTSSGSCNILDVEGIENKYIHRFLNQDTKLLRMKLNFLKSHSGK